MMGTLRNLATLTLVALMLSACGSSHHITYSGHEESTEGVPGFVNGKKVSPNIKLGQSYSVDGDTYVPRHQPDYVEEGMASWYGPGFHGGKTANGEEFDKHAMTAAHRTLPLPSIVKVTLLSTGKSAYVRINDRGPYAHSRIIDLSYGAAKEIGMIAKGTGRVRVEYKLAESQRFADLLSQGRSPESIDIAEEVLPYGNQPKQATQYASNAAPSQPVQPAPYNKGLLDNLNPIASANASEIESGNVTDNDDSNAVDANDLAAPITNKTTFNQPGNVIQPRGDPPPIMPNQLSPPVTPQPMARAPAVSVPPNAQSPPQYTGQGVYIQLGSFSQQANALHMQQKVASVGTVSIQPKPSGSMLLYRVRMGPYDPAQANAKVAQLRALGVADMSVVKQ